MTTVAMVAGMLPIALSLTGDGSWRAPMGVTVIGGLIFSTVLTLLLVPAYFSIAISIESRIGQPVPPLHRQRRPAYARSRTGGVILGFRSAIERQWPS